eukprot:8178285-Ditylum_brightwellii.AAC.1
MTTTTRTTNITEKNVTTHNDDTRPKNTTGNTFQNDAKYPERKVHRGNVFQVKPPDSFHQKEPPGDKTA